MPLGSFKYPASPIQNEVARLTDTSRTLFDRLESECRNSAYESLMGSWSARQDCDESSAEQLFGLMSDVHCGAARGAEHEAANG
jgi:hypothetical protein